MLAFILRRIFQSAIVLLVVGLVAFSLFRFVGDPIDNMLGQERTIEDVERLRERLGLNDSFPVQYWNFLTRAIQGDFGVSYRQSRPVSEIISERAPATLELAAVSGTLAISIGIVLGIFTAIFRRGVASSVIMTLSLIGVSLPTFLIGILLIYFFAVGVELPYAIPWPSWSPFLKCAYAFPAIGSLCEPLSTWRDWLPSTSWITNTSLGLSSFGRGEVTNLCGFTACEEGVKGWWSTGFLTESGLKALILPSITLGLFQMTLIMRLVRSEMLEVLRQDYIRFARARGLKERAVNFRHALKNTLVPVITVTGLQLGAIIAFAIITETVFQWPGVGLLFINSIQFVDIPVMAAYLMLISVMFVAINLIVDLLYFAVDPRLRIEGRHS